MSMTDPIADLLTRLRNALLAGHESVEIPHSKRLEEILGIFRDEGYIAAYEKREGKPFSTLVVALRYDNDRRPVIQTMRRVSKPGRRVYTGKDEIPKVLGGMGINIVSTSRGIMTGSKARALGVGGEILCEVY